MLEVTEAAVLEELHQTTANDTRVPEQEEGVGPRRYGLVRVQMVAPWDLQVVVVDVVRIVCTAKVVEETPDEMERTDRMEMEE